jgi:hypothetical protein
MRLGLKPERTASPLLAWLAWIMARFGGWNCYYKPPGRKTMRAGWDRFAAMAQASSSPDLHPPPARRPDV